MKPLIRCLFPLPFVVMGFSLYAQILDAPADIAAALVLKLSAFEKSIASAGAVRIYVLNAPKVADELRKCLGQHIGQSILDGVQAGNKLPEMKPDILYVGDSSMLTQALVYTRNKKILSITGKPDLVNEGVALGIGVGNDGKPKVILNLSATTEENLTWNPAILKMARIIK